MRAPNIAYIFTTPTDTAGPTFETLLLNQSLAQAAASHVITLDDLPKDRVLVLANANLSAQPGAGQNINSMGIQIVTHTGVVSNIISILEPLAADVNHVLSWQGEIWIKGGGAGAASLRVSVGYNAGANINTTGVDWAGIVVPAGNIAAR